jgi:hypothetical protein
MILPPQVFEVVGPLFETLPLDRAMGDLVVRRPADQPALKLARGIVAEPGISRRLELVVGIWLFVDELDASHTVAQALASQTGSLWHAIVHRREGDFENSRYWYRQAGDHPVLSRPGPDPMRLVELAKAGDPAGIALQREEWANLFEWCATNT